MKYLLFILSSVLLSSCSGSSGYEGYKEETFSTLLLNSIPETPKGYVFINKDEKKYFQVIRYDNHWELSHPMYGPSMNTKIPAGYHLYDGKGYAGYDWDDSFKTLEEAKSAATSRGDVFLMNLGNDYDYHDGSFYDNSNFKKLKKLEQ